MGSGTYLSGNSIKCKHMFKKQRNESWKQSMSQDFISVCRIQSANLDYGISDSKTFRFFWRTYSEINNWVREKSSYCLFSLKVYGKGTNNRALI